MIRTSQSPGKPRITLPLMRVASGALERAIALAAAQLRAGEPLNRDQLQFLAAAALKRLESIGGAR